MGTLNLLMALFLGVTVATKENYETSLRVLGPELPLNKTLKLTCGGIKESPHPLARVSWILFSGKKEEQLKATETGELELTLLANRTGAYVTCRSHARLPRYLLVMATPPLQLRIAALPGTDISQREELTFIVVTAQINSSNYTEGAPYKTRVGESIVVNCSSINLPFNRVIYKYLLQRNAAGDVEKELAAAIPTNTRDWNISTQFIVSAEDHNTHVYCLARWFKDVKYYESTTAVRSEPILLVVETGPLELQKPQDYGFPYVWVAVGVGALGWLFAVTSLGVLCFTRRNNLSTATTDSMTVLDGVGKGGCCVSSNSSINGPLGATILPSESAHSLAAANIKLTPQAAPPAQHDKVVYCNLEELNTLMKKKVFPRF